MKIQNLIVNHKLRPVKLNSDIYVAMKIKFKARIDNWEGFFSYNHTDQPGSVKAYIVHTLPLPFFLKWGKQVLITSLTAGGGIW